MTQNLWTFVIDCSQWHKFMDKASKKCHWLQSMTKKVSLTASKLYMDSDWRVWRLPSWVWLILVMFLNPLRKWVGRMKIHVGWESRWCEQQRSLHLVRHGSKMGALMKRHTVVVLASCWARIISTSIFLVPEDGGNMTIGGLCSCFQID